MKKVIDLLHRSGAKAGGWTTATVEDTQGLPTANIYCCDEQSGRQWMSCVHLNSIRPALAVNREQGAVELDLNAAVVAMLRIPGSEELVPGVSAQYRDAVASLMQVSAEFLGHEEIEPSELRNGHHLILVRLTEPDGASDFQSLVLSAEDLDTPFPVATEVLAALVAEVALVRREMGEDDFADSEL